MWQLLESRSSHPDNILLWAACCTFFFGFLRSGEVTVTSLKDYDPEAHHSDGDVPLDRLSDPSVVRVHIKASKTDPFRKGILLFWGRILVQSQLTWKFMGEAQVRLLLPVWSTTVERTLSEGSQSCTENQRV